MLEKSRATVFVRLGMSRSRSSWPYRPKNISTAFPSPFFFTLCQGALCFVGEISKNKFGLGHRWKEGDGDRRAINIVQWFFDNMFQKKNFFIHKYILCIFWRADVLTRGCFWRADVWAFFTSIIYPHDHAHKNHLNKRFCTLPSPFVRPLTHFS